MNDSEFIRKRPKASNSVADLFGAAHRVIPLFIMLFGLTVASTHLAINHPDIVGSDVEPIVVWNTTIVYAPWVWIISAIKIYSFEAVAEDWYAAFQKSSIAVYVSVASAIAVYFIMSYLRGLNHHFDSIHGTARWATTKEMKKAGLMAESGIVLGEASTAKISYSADEGEVVYKLKKEARILAHSGKVHTLLCAPTRTGKGISVLIPSLISFRGSVVVIDPKGENYKRTAGFRSQFSHVVLFEPLSEDSIKINVLQEIRAGREGYGDAGGIALTIQCPSGDRAKEGSAESHFEKKAIALLTASICHVLTCDYYKDKSLGDVFDLLCAVNNRCKNDDSDGGTSFLEEMLTSPHTDSIIEESLKRDAQSLLDTPEKERGSVISSVVTAMGLWNDPVIRDNTSAHEICVDDFISSEAPVSLYISIPFSDMERLSPLLRVIITFIIKKLSSGKTSHGDIKLKNRLLIILDEFPILGAFSFLATSAGILAGFGITLLIVVQSLSQLSNVYGDKHSFLDHCKIWVAFAPGDLATAEMFSKIIGRETVWKDQISTSGSKFDLGMNNMNLSGSEIERNLMNADEVMKLTPDRTLVFCNGLPPYIGKKVIYYSDSRFKNYADMPYAITRDEILADTPNGGSPIEFWKADPNVERPSEISLRPSDDIESYARSNFTFPHSDDAAMPGFANYPKPRIVSEEEVLKTIDAEFIDNNLAVGNEATDDINPATDSQPGELTEEEEAVEI